MILAYLIPLALLAGLIRGGSLRHYIDRPLRGVLLPCLAFLLEASLSKLPGWLNLPPQVCLVGEVALQYALLTAFCLLNIRRRGMKLLSLGVLLNMAVIFANGFQMPVGEFARDIAALQPTIARIDCGELIEYAVRGPEAPLYFLGDVIYLPFLPNGLASAGDLLLGGGVFLLLLDMMKPVPKEEKTCV